MSLWRYDIPRQSAKAFLLGLTIAIAAGLIITFMWRVPPRIVEEVIVAGEIDGAAAGLRDGRAESQRVGRESARADVTDLIATGTESDGRRIAVDVAWNEAIAHAIDQAATTPVLQLRRMSHWEALQR